MNIYISLKSIIRTQCVIYWEMESSLKFVEQCHTFLFLPFVNYLLIYITLSRWAMNHLLLPENIRDLFFRLSLCKNYSYTSHSQHWKWCKEKEHYLIQSIFKTSLNQSVNHYRWERFFILSDKYRLFCNTILSFQNIFEQV